MTYNEEILKDLSEEERNEVLKILGELSKDGKSDTYNKLLYEDYDEIPVDVETFLKDPRYLGKGLIDAEGRFTVFPYWVETMKKIFPNNLDTAYNTLILTGAIGIGKAQPLDAKVLTDSGYKMMKDLSLSDKIYGSDGKLHKLLGIFPQGIKKIYKVTFTDGTSTECCDEHLWTILPKNQKRYSKTIELRELIDKPLFRLNRGKYKERLYYIPMTEPIQFNHKDTFIDPYLLGCLIGDGSLTANNITLTSADTDIIDRCNSSLIANYMLKPVSKYTYRLRKINRTTIRENNVLKNAPNLYVEEIQRLKLNTTAKFKHIPEEYLYNDVNSRIALLQGLMDTDGTINKNGSVIQFNTISPQLRDDFIWLVESLGGSAWYSETQGSYFSKKYNKNILCNTSYTIGLKLPKNISPFHIRRKRSRLNPKAINPSRAIENIEYIGQKECQCIYIDSEEHLYLTNNFIVTHNTMIASLCLLYQLHRLLCLKDPYLHYGLQPIDKITISLINITLDAAKGVAWDKLQQLIQTSEWFMSHGTLKGKSNIEYIPDKRIELIVGSRNGHIIGRAVFASFEDEINFSAVTTDIEKIKSKALKLITQVDARMQSRFMRNDKLPTLNIIASSKDSEQSFLETYIDTKKKNESKTTLIVDEPQWVIRTDKNSNKTFYVAVGNKFLASELLPKDASEEYAKEYIRKGYQLLKVPMGYYENFRDNIDIALTDIAGISTVNALKYISGIRWNEIKKKDYVNPFTKDIIEVGNASDDNTQYSDYFNINLVPNNLKSKPLFIHLDMSISGDKTGIAGVWITGKKPSIEGQNSSKELFYKVAFSVAIKAPKGYQISFEKNRTFIRWLREQGFNIRHISSDTFQSAQIQQQLKADDFDTSILSVDRVESESKVCLPYQYLKSTIYERRLEVYDKCDLLTEEIIGLERLSNGKIEHPDSGHSGSKDTADALAGALYSASKFGDEFAYDFGEDLKQAIDVSASTSAENYRKQVNIDFEKQLQQMFNPVNLVNNPSENNGDLTKISADNNLYNDNEITQEQLEKAAPMQINPPSFVVQPKPNQPIVIGRDILLW